MSAVHSAARSRASFVRVISAVLVAAFAACSSDSDDVSRRDCERLRDHLIEVRLEAVTADREQHRAALEAAVGSSFIDGCLEQMSPGHLRCSLAASDSSALAECVEPASR